LEGAAWAGYAGEVARTVDDVVLYDLLTLAVNERATTRVRAVAWREAEQLKGWLNANKSAGDLAQQAHVAYAAAQSSSFRKIRRRRSYRLPPSRPMVRRLVTMRTSQTQVCELIDAIGTTGQV